MTTTLLFLGNVTDRRIWRLNNSVWWRYKAVSWRRKKYLFKDTNKVWEEEITTLSLLHWGHCDFEPSNWIKAAIPQTHCKLSWIRASCNINPESGTRYSKTNAEDFFPCLWERPPDNHWITSSLHFCLSFQVHLVSVSMPPNLKQHTTCRKKKGTENKR